MEATGKNPMGIWFIQYDDQSNSEYIIDTNLPRMRCLQRCLDWARHVWKIIRVVDAPGFLSPPKPDHGKSSFPNGGKPQPSLRAAIAPHDVSPKRVLRKSTRSDGQWQLVLIPCSKPLPIFPCSSWHVFGIWSWLNLRYQATKKTGVQLCIVSKIPSLAKMKRLNYRSPTGLIIPRLLAISRTDRRWNSARWFFMNIRLEFKPHSLHLSDCTHTHTYIYI